MVDKAQEEPEEGRFTAMLQYDPDSSALFEQKDSMIRGGRMTKRFDGLTIVSPMTGDR
jgi:hypothetical protein